MCTAVEETNIVVNYYYKARKNSGPNGILTHDL